MPTESLRVPRARAAGPGKPTPPSAQAFETWVLIWKPNAKSNGDGSMRPTD